MRRLKEKEKEGREITEQLYENGMILTWFKDKPEGWTLVSGIWSPFYINLRNIGCYPQLLNKIGIAMGNMIINELGCNNNNKIVGIASAGVPIATVIANYTRLPLCYTRKLEGVRSIDDFSSNLSKYGQHCLVEGIFEEENDFILVDDLVTKLSSKLIAKKQLEYEVNKRNSSMKIYCNKIAVLLDREQGALKTALNNDMLLVSLIPFKSKAIDWLKDKMSVLEYEVIKDYLENNENYQNKSTQNMLKKQALNDKQCLTTL